MSEFIKVWFLGPSIKGGILVRCAFEPYVYFYTTRCTYHEELRSTTMLEF